MDESTEKVQVEFRFWSKVKKGPGCWEWTAAKSYCGYGQFRYTGTMKSAHRISWMLTYGSLDKAIQVLHRCDNPGCVNPEHLFLGTHQINMKDRTLKGRAAKKLTKELILKIRDEYKLGVSQYALADKYNLQQSTVGEIIRKEIWAWVS